MSALRRLVQRLRSLFRSDALDRDFDEEVRSHIEFAIDDFMQQGLSEADATRLARARFGLVEASRDAHRQSRSLMWVETIAFDSRQAWRSLWSAKAFSLTVIATMTVAVALNTSVFVVMDAVLFRGFPLVKDHDRVLFLQEQGPQGACCLSYLDFEDWQSQAQSFEALAFVRSKSFSIRDGAGRPFDVSGTQLSTNAFRVLGVAPALGRDFMGDDMRPGATPVVILSHRFWQSRFQGRADVVGSTLHVDGQAATVIGVMPERFEFPLRIIGNFWMPVPDTPDIRARGLANSGFVAVARLRDGVTREQARAELETINQRLAIDHPDTNRSVVPRLASHSDWNSGTDAPLIWGSLWVASCLVLLIACANLANLMLVRTLGRWRELATKLALGAGPMRVMRQLAIESLVLALIAAGAAWWLVIWGVGTWDVVTFSMYQVLDYSIDARAFVYLIGAASIATLLMAAPPMFRVMQAGEGDAMKGDARGVTGRLRGKRLGNVLVAVQIGLAIVLLAGAGVLVRSFEHIVRADAGVKGADNVLVGLMRMPSANYMNQGDRRQYVDRLKAALAAAPGVEHVAVASTAPTRFAATRFVEFEGRPRQPDDERIGFVKTSADYLSVIGARAVDGRTFSDADLAGTLPVAMVNQAFADRYWPGQSAVGKRIRSDSPLTPEWRVVVGVTSNIMHNDPLRQNFRPVVYVPMVQEPLGLTVYWFARTTMPADRMATTMRPLAEGVDPNVDLEIFSSLADSFAFDRDFMDVEHSELGKHARVAPLFAGIALILSALGLISIIGYSVDQRNKEIGIRMAIGATAIEIQRLILREGMRPVLAGLVGGMAAAVALNRLLRSQLVAVSPNDPVVLISAAATILVVAIIASLLPIRRAVSVDPVIALRAD